LALEGVAPDADASQLLTLLLLRPRGERPSRRTPSYAEKLSPPHPHPWLRTGIVSAITSGLEEAAKARPG